MSSSAHDVRRADDDDAAQLQDVSNIGEIRVTFTRVVRVKLTKREIQKREKKRHSVKGHEAVSYEQFPGTGPVLERSKKAGAHCITYALSQMHLNGT